MNKDEIFYPLKDWEDYYEINRNGVIRSIERPFVNSLGAKRVHVQRIMGSWVNPKGYRYVALSCFGVKQIKLTLHRLLAIQFIPNPENYPVINHKNGNPLDNSLSNLEWTSLSYNSWHSINVLGNKVHNKNLSVDAVKDIYLNTYYDSMNTYRKGKFSVNEMAEKYSLGKTAIFNIVNKKTYLEITDTLPNIEIFIKKGMNRDETNLRRRERRLKVKQQKLENKFI